MTNPYVREPGEDMDVWLKRIDPDAVERVRDAGSPMLWLMALPPEKAEAVRLELEKQLRPRIADNAPIPYNAVVNTIRTISGGKPSP